MRKPLKYQQIRNYYLTILHMLDCITIAVDTVCPTLQIEWFEPTKLRTNKIPNNPSHIGDRKKSGEISWLQTLGYFLDKYVK